MNNPELSYLKVLQPGISSIQDSGRIGYYSEGIPVSGFLDVTSAGLANLLVGNQSSSACIEWSILPPKLQFKDESNISVTGAKAKVYINNREVERYKSIVVPKNGILSFGAVENGIYGYIAITGGFKTEKVLGSRSWFLKVTKYHNFLKGMEIKFNLNCKSQKPNTRLVYSNYNQNNEGKHLEVFSGPEFKLLSKQQQDILLNTSFSSSVNRNRMGIQLKTNFEQHKFNIISSPVLPGTVQWTPSGKLIILMKDAQTIGGYPRLLQLSNKSLDIVSQLNYNFKFSLKE